ncbi:MAG: hypothetical protein RL754_1231 [Bacteroidota bacterium]|jgi:ATP-dependent RNA helicase RhlE
MTFKELGLDPTILEALEKKGYTTPTPIQAQSIPILLKGHDLLGCAQTGTGKTAAFTIPIIQKLLPEVRQKNGPIKIAGLIVTPTRELAIQIGDSIRDYSAGTGIKSAVIFGGVGQNPQVDRIKKGVHLLVATPGRLLDLHGQGFIDLRHLKFFVLDEADQMLDMGFIHDIRKLLRVIPAKRQSLFFSATMPMPIVELSTEILGEYERVTIRPEKPTADRVSQCAYYVAKNDKPNLLIELLNEHQDQAIVFGRTKHGCDKVVRILTKKGIKAAAIHGNKSQNARQKALNAFKAGEMRILVATDIAARGIDISGLEWVLNYDLPNISETYVHRIGRTGRADAAGESISFCSAEERAYLRDIEKLIKQTIPVIEDHPFAEGAAEEWSNPENRVAPKQGGGGGRRPARNSGSSNNEDKRPGGGVRNGKSKRPGGGGDKRRSRPQH